MFEDDFENMCAGLFLLITEMIIFNNQAQELSGSLAQWPAYVEQPADRSQWISFQ